MSFTSIPPNLMSSSLSFSPTISTSTYVNLFPILLPFPCSYSPPVSATLAFPHAHIVGLDPCTPPGPAVRLTRIKESVTSGGREVVVVDIENS